MPDDIERLMRGVEAQDPSSEFLARLREQVITAAGQRVSTGSEITEEVVGVELRTNKKETAMRKTHALLLGAAAALILIVGLVLVAGRTDDEPMRPSNTPASSATEGSNETESSDNPLSDGEPALDADAGCGLDERASIDATVDPSGASVTIDVESDAACSGVAVRVVATPANQGFPIDKAATLDENGSASVTDHLQSTRAGAQSWSVELIVVDTGGIAATGEFSGVEVCDVQDAVLNATYLPETNEVNIVLVVDPTCEGESFTFDRSGQLFPGAPSGGWKIYSADENGRIDITEPLLVDGPIIGIEAYRAPETRGILSERVARIALDIG